MKVIIKKSTNPNKKYMATFYDTVNGKRKKVKTTHFTLTRTFANKYLFYIFIFFGKHR